jgi:beta-xylosidase
LAEDGITVFESDDLKSWSVPKGAKNGLALQKDDVWADRWFWAPEVYFVNNKFYMYYSADEHICVATANSPLGPFTQAVKKPMIENEKCIDNSLFIDDDGKPYLLFDRFNDGLNIWIAELESDLMTIKPKTMKKCIAVSQPWEEVQARVNEGSFIVKRNGIYYLSYSANHYKSQFYGIGYATSENILGPYKKYDENPIYQKQKNLVGVGHSSMFTDKEGQLRIVFHAHNSNTEIHPRLMYISSVHFKNESGRDIMHIDPDFIAPQLVE